MIIIPGSIVRAKAGRDKDSFFVVVKTEDSFAYICDGKRRKVEKPKKKKLIHLQATNSIVRDSMDTNRKIRKALSEYTQSAV